MNEEGVKHFNFWGNVPSNIAVGKRTFKTSASRWVGSGIARRKQRNKQAQSRW